MHRGGIIAQQDIPKGMEYLEISYRKIEILQGIKSGTLSPLQVGFVMTEESQIYLQSVIHQKVQQFKIGEQIKFETDDDFIHIYQTFAEFTGFLQNRLANFINLSNHLSNLIKTKLNSTLK